MVFSASWRDPKKKTNANTRGRSGSRAVPVSERVYNSGRVVCAEDQAEFASAGVWRAWYRVLMKTTCDASGDKVLHLSAASLLHQPSPDQAPSTLDALAITRSPLHGEWSRLSEHPVNPSPVLTCALAGQPVPSSYYRSGRGCGRDLRLCHRQTAWKKKKGWGNRTVQVIT